MYFYVFIQPEIFEEAALDGEDAIQNVSSLLNGFLQNCFLTVFQDDRWETSVKEKLEKWPETMSRNLVKRLLVHLKKQHRFLYCRGNCKTSGSRRIFQGRIKKASKKNSQKFI